MRKFIWMVETSPSYEYVIFRFKFNISKSSFYYVDILSLVDENMAWNMVYFLQQVMSLKN